MVPCAVSCSDVPVSGTLKGFHESVSLRHGLEHLRCDMRWVLLLDSSSG